MDYLLDTQAIIWTLEDNPQLPESVKDTIEDTQNTIAITIVNLWEIAIKRSINKLKLKAELTEIKEQIASKQVMILPITIEHLTTLENLEYRENHKDPFDRLIISQAMTEDLIIISNDSHFSKYPVKVFWQD